MEVTKMSNNNSPDMNKQDDQEVMLPGFRFHPTDEELVGFYLRRKVEKKPISIDIIKHVDIYKYDPWDLPRVSTVGDKEWYFFCIRGRKYRNSIRPNRVTGSGFWKATGIDKPIHSVNKEPHGHECLGLKKSLVYYRGSAGKGTKTDWMMHEFRLPPNGKSTNLSSNVKDIAQEAEVWTLCRIFKRTPSYKKYTPNWKDSITNLAANAIKHNPADSSSKTCSSSLESETSCEQQQYMHQFQEQNETKPFINERNHLFMTQSQSQSQSPYSASFSRFWNPNSDDFFTNGNWDELRSVVELAIDPSHVYDYKCSIPSE